ncbi:MAG TPA: hypothetical protein VLI41_09435 [Phenylobacterium sp.]|uniref:hypothetical protein n=1 Tax=Phenylobacterium sp. TaxID=1871053 RepID=UPI002BE0772E|nr:hypothetical protein [Phenylobacterium sp.]HSV03415.1 hypothetical protein [Phenylobacterium sp.]
MLRGLSRLITRPAAGPVASLAAIALAGALVGSLVNAHQEQRFLKARIAALATQDASELQAELISCRATARSYEAQVAVAGPAPADPRWQAARTPAGRRRIAADLVTRPPAGIDLCARMESADQAVMKALDRK